MSSYQCKSSNPNAQQAVSIANEVLSLYLSGRKEESLKKSKKFFSSLNKYEFGADFVNEKLFKSKIKNAEDVKFNEYNSARIRISCALSGEKIEDFGYDHNVMFIDWFLYEIGLIEKTNMSPELTQIRSNYFRDPHFFFSRDDEKQHSGNRADAFFRSAYRAEIYAHQTFTLNLHNSGLEATVTYTLKTGKTITLKAIGMYDMFTPLILSRMAVEQYLKALYEKELKKPAEGTVSKIRETLLNRHILPKGLSNEIYSVIKRGNTNTHSGEATYNFGIMHGIEVLKKCSELFR